MITSIYTDSEGNTVEEQRKTADGPVVARTVTSADGGVTNTASGAQVGIQARNVNGRNVRR